MINLQYGDFTNTEIAYDYEDYYYYYYDHGFHSTDLRGAIGLDLSSLHDWSIANAIYPDGTIMKTASEPGLDFNYYYYYDDEGRYYYRNAYELWVTDCDIDAVLTVDNTPLRAGDSSTRWIYISEGGVLKINPGVTLAADRLDFGFFAGEKNGKIKVEGTLDISSIGQVFAYLAGDFFTGEGAREIQIVELVNDGEIVIGNSTLSLEETLRLVFGTNTVNVKEFGDLFDGIFAFIPEHIAIEDWNVWDHRAGGVIPLENGTYVPYDGECFVRVDESGVYLTFEGPVFGDWIIGDHESGDERYVPEGDTRMVAPWNVLIGVGEGANNNKLAVDGKLIVKNIYVGAANNGGNEMEVSGELNCRNIYVGYEANSNGNTFVLTETGFINDYPEFGEGVIWVGSPEGSGGNLVYIKGGYDNGFNISRKVVLAYGNSIAWDAALDEEEFMNFMDIVFDYMGYIYVYNSDLNDIVQLTSENWQDYVTFEYIAGFGWKMTYGVVPSYRTEDWIVGNNKSGKVRIVAAEKTRTIAPWNVRVGVGEGANDNKLIVNGELIVGDIHVGSAGNSGNEFEVTGHVECRNVYIGYEADSNDNLFIISGTMGDFPDGGAGYIFVGSPEGSSGNVLWAQDGSATIGSSRKVVLSYGNAFAWDVPGMTEEQFYVVMNIWFTGTDVFYVYDNELEDIVRLTMANYLDYLEISHTEFGWTMNYGYTPPTGIAPAMIDEVIVDTAKNTVTITGTSANENCLFAVFAAERLDAEEEDWVDLEDIEVVADGESFSITFEKGGGQGFFRVVTINTTFTETAYSENVGGYYTVELPVGVSQWVAIQLDQSDERLSKVFGKLNYNSKVTVEVAPGSFIPVTRQNFVEWGEDGEKIEIARGTEVQVTATGVAGSKVELVLSGTLSNDSRLTKEHPAAPTVAFASSTLPIEGRLEDFGVGSELNQTITRADEKGALVPLTYQAFVGWGSEGAPVIRVGEAFRLRNANAVNWTQELVIHPESLELEIINK